MSGKKMNYWCALCVLEFNYPSGTLCDDREWTEEMIRILTADPKADKREVCKRHNLQYPPKEYFDWFFANNDKPMTYDDLRRMRG